MQQLYLDEPPPTNQAAFSRRKVRIYGFSETQYKALEELSQQVLGKKSVSEMIKIIVGEYLQAKQEEPQPKVNYRRKLDNKRYRIEIRLSAAEYDYLQQMGQLHEMTHNQIVVNQIRYLIDRYPTPSVAELNALRLSNVRLLQIGRNVNQIAKHLNAAQGATLSTQLLNEIKSAFAEHTQKIGDLICESKKRYAERTIKQQEKAA